MKKLFFYSTFLFAFIFTNCKKEENEPSHNQLVVVDRSGKTIVSKPFDTKLSFTTYDHEYSLNTTRSSTAADDFTFRMHFKYDESGDVITFNSNGQGSGEISMYVESLGTGQWIATGGTANIETKYCKTIFSDYDKVKFKKVTLNTVQFTRSSYQNPGLPDDTIWVSGIISAYR